MPGTPTWMGYSTVGNRAKSGFLIPSLQQSLWLILQMVVLYLQKRTFVQTSKEKSSSISETAF